MCRAAVQKTGRCKWTYSFEAECLLHAVPSPKYTDPGVEQNVHQFAELCSGVVGDGLPALPTGHPSQCGPDALLVILGIMGDTVNARPMFAELFNAATDKLEFIERVKPHV